MIKDFNIGVKGVVRADGRCLVLKSTRNGRAYWDIPGGRIDDGETIEETLKRELSEELPTLGEYSIGKILNAYRLSHDLADGKGLMLIFYEVDARPFEVRLSSEHVEFKWVSKSDIPALREGVEAIMESGYCDAIEAALR